VRAVTESHTTERVEDITRGKPRIRIPSGTGLGLREGTLPPYSKLLTRNDPAPDPWGGAERAFFLLVNDMSIAWARLMDFYTMPKVAAYNAICT